jgi:hypothetical protein
MQQETTDIFGLSVIDRVQLDALYANISIHFMPINFNRTRITAPANPHIITDECLLLGCVLTLLPSTSIL